MMSDSQPPAHITNTESNYGAQGVFNAPVHFHADSSIVSKRDRKTLLSRVRTSWIRGMLAQSMEGATFIPLGLYDRPDLIENHWVPVVQEAEGAERQLPLGTSLTQVYDEAGGELLILGEPGSGKTTLLLHMANELLDRASLDDAHSMPAVFNLSTWADKRQPLTEWLIEELSTKYQIPQQMGKPWVDGGQILPLLDGLDEVSSEHRGACVGAINAYRQTHGQVPLVIGSRLAEYSVLVTKIVMRRAVVVQPMTLPQIQEYLEKAEEQLDALQDLLRDEPDFQELAKNPLMLSILKRTYQGKTVHITRNVSLEARRQQIFTDYVQRMFQHRSVETRYSPRQTKDWLIWLAQQMKQRNQTDFYLERLQIDWLARSRSGEIYTSLAFGLLSFPIAVGVYGLEYSFYGLKSALVKGTLAGLLTAVIAFFFVWFIETDIRLGTLFPGGSKRIDTPGERKKNKRFSRFTAFITPFLGERAGFALLSGLLEGILVEFLAGPLYALINGLFLAAFLIVLGKFERTIQPAEKLLWSWKSVWEHAGRSVLLGSMVGVLGGVFDALPYLQTFNVFLTTLYFWLSLGVALGLIIMLMRGFSSSMLDTEQVIKPNQGIRNSLSNSLRLGFSSGALLGGVIFFFYSYVMHNVFVVGYINDIPKNADVIYSVGDAVAVAYLFWLINGGFATIQHLTLRILLWKTKSAPWRYPHFLDHAHDRILLRKVGGGYNFVHILLRDYFAHLGIEESVHPASAENNQSGTTFSSSATSSEKEDQDVQTAPLLLIPVLADVPRLLSCGHEQRDHQARFCSVCGRSVSPASLND